MREELTKCIKATAGLMLFALGVYMIIQANLGAAPWDVLCIALAGRTELLYGTVSMLVSAALILVDVFLLKEKIGLGTILDAVVVGKTVDLLNWIDILPAMEGSIVLRILVLLVAFLIEALGQYIYMKQGLAFGPRDTLQIGLGKRFPNLSIGFVNTIILAIVFTLGWLLGGPVGIASVLAPLGIGLSQNLMFRLFHFDPKGVANDSVRESLCNLRV